MMGFMQKISDITIQQVRGYEDIVAVVSDYVQLKKRGKNFIGLCPFHSEKTPSFTVSPEKHIFHCFGCHESGDHISFLQKVDGLTFQEAVEKVALKAGIDVQYEESKGYSSAQDAIKEDLKEILVLAREYYKSAFMGSKGEAYLKDRGVSSESITSFHIGFAPNSFSLLDLLEQKGFKKDSIQKSGLVYAGENGLVPRFRNRVMFPILDYMGRTVGFGGRVLPGDNGAKYVNTEETVLFNKRRLFYGLNQAKSSIQKWGYALLMEGYLDVIMSHQYGFTNAIAAMGTAITESHAQKLKRFTNTVYFAMDSDDAGQTAIEKSIGVLHQFGIKSFVVSFSEKDPADFLASHGPQAFSALLEKRRHIVEFQLDRVVRSRDLNQIEQVSEIINQMVPVLMLEPDEIVLRHYIHEISLKLNVDESLIMAKVKNPRYNVRYNPNFSTGQKKNKIQKAEEMLMLAMAIFPEARSKLIGSFPIESLFKNEWVGLAKVTAKSTFFGNDLLNELTGTEWYPKLSRLFVSVLSQIDTDSFGKEWEDYLDVILSQASERQIAELKQRIVDLEKNGGDEAEISVLLSQLQQLIQKK